MEDDQNTYKYLPSENEQPVMHADAIIVGVFLMAVFASFTVNAYQLLRWALGI